MPHRINMYLILKRLVISSYNINLEIMSFHYEMFLIFPKIRGDLYLITTVSHCQFSSKQINMRNNIKILFRLKLITLCILNLFVRLNKTDINRSYKIGELETEN